MRSPIAFLACLTLALPLLAAAPALAHNHDKNGDNAAYNNANGDRAPRMCMESRTASLPLNSYRTGDAYIVNPIDMTNTRDNRGSIVDGTDWRAFRDENREMNHENGDWTPHHKHGGPGDANSSMNQ